jgi:hypothetical protein
MNIRLKSGAKNYGPGRDVQDWTLSIKAVTSRWDNTPKDEPPRTISMTFTPLGPAPGIAATASQCAPDSNYKEAELTFSIQECRRFLKALTSYVDQVELMGHRAEIVIPMKSK